MSRICGSFALVGWTTKRSNDPCAFPKVQITCQRCGLVFNCRCHRAKYCPDCKRTPEYKDEQRQKAKRRAQRLASPNSRQRSRDSRKGEMNET